jgi:hypothetical protein
MMRGVCVVLGGFGRGGLYGRDGRVAGIEPQNIEVWNRLRRWCFNGYLFGFQGNRKGCPYGWFDYELFAFAFDLT